MSPHSNNHGEPRGHEPDEPATKEAGRGPARETDGQRAHGGDQAGPASDDSGRPLAPQTGAPIDHAH